MAYLPLSTANLPDPVIDPAQGASPEDYFNTVLTTSTGSTLSVDVGFAADFLWTKARNFGRSHELHDRVRGDNVRLLSNDTNAEQSYSNYVVFDADGADLGTNHNLGYHAGGTTTGVVWAWKANGSGVSNTDGSITSTVSANTTSGFSIVKLSDPNNGASYNVGHGLNSPPEMFFIKKRNTTSDWSVYHKDVGNDRRLVLNGTDAQSGSSSVYFGSTTPTSTVVTIGSGLSTGDDWIMYCFHSVEGFSKFGSYTGNGSSDGPFVYTGFRPAFVMVKVASAAGERWQIHDTSREAYNGAIAAQFADGALVDNTSSTYAFDILSNGFKPRTSHEGSNYNGQTLIYMAFAENPFKYSNAR